MTENVNDKIAKAMMDEKLEGYLPERIKDVRREPSLSELARAREPKYWVPKEATPRKTWEEREPLLRTPHVLSQDRAAKRLAGVRAGVRVVGGEVVLSADQLEVIVSEVTGMMLDCAEGAGLVVKGRFVGGKVREFVKGLVLGEMMFWDEDGKYLGVKVED